MGLPERVADYQQFTLTDDGPIDPGQRMQAKMRAIPLGKNLSGYSVLDVGCDMGYWSFLCASRGADVLGIDRNRPVQGVQTDLVAENTRRAGEHGLSARFAHIEVGRNWWWCGEHDIVLCMSMYHHAYALCQDHHALMFWLRLQCRTNGMLIWEGPTDCQDPVSRAHIPVEAQPGYNESAMLDAMGRYFSVTHTGPAEHEPYRKVYVAKAKPLRNYLFDASIQSGAGGANKAWAYANGRRKQEMLEATAMSVIPGSLNMIGAMDWSANCFRSRFLDVADRKAGVDSMWTDRWCRLYPCRVNGIPGYVFRFEGEHYPDDFVEVVSSVRLRDVVDDVAQVLL